MAPPLTRSRSGEGPDISRRRGQASNGQSSQTKVAAYVICFLVVYVTASTIYQSHFAGMFVPDIEVDPETGKARVRRRPHRHKQKLDPSKATTEVDAVLEGYLTLIDINIPKSALQGVDAYRGVTAKFCHIDWKLQQKAPHKVPMFNDLIRQSSLCDTTMTTVDLWDMAKQARAYDDQMSVSQQIWPVPPTGIVFHESRCGSTLMANLLAGFSPEHTRMYSENTVHLRSLMACGSNPCNPTLHTQLIQDVFYLSGRTVRKERPQYVFYKISSLGSMFVDSFTTAFPKVPWTYLYRDTVEVMQSHFVPSTVGGITRSRDRPVCLRLQSNDPQPSLTVQIANSKERDPTTLSNEEYCAAHLSALSLSAIQEHQRSQKGRFVNYNQLPDAVWEDLLPKEYGVPVDSQMVERMKVISQSYSKARNKMDNVSFEKDSETKRQSASPEVMEAAKTFASDIYQQLEILSGQNNPGGGRRN